MLLYHFSSQDLSVVSPKHFGEHTYTMSDVRCSKYPRSFFYDIAQAGETRFFNTKIESELIGGKYFITSERQARSMPKQYTIRQPNSNGTISTVGQFQGYGSKANAKDEIEHLLNEEKFRNELAKEM